MAPAGSGMALALDVDTWVGNFAVKEEHLDNDVCGAIELGLVWFRAHIPASMSARVRGRTWVGLLNDYNQQNVSSHGHDHEVCVGGVNDTCTETYTRTI